MKGRALPVLALVALGAAALAATAGAGSSSVARSQAVSCNSTLKLALVTPLTGGGGFIGKEQLTWAKYAVKTCRRSTVSRCSSCSGDTPVEKGAGEALVVAQKFIADPKVVAVIGPATSGGVASASQALIAAGLAHISPSATRTSLTKGANREATHVVLPRRARRLHPGPDRRELHGRQAQRQEGRRHRLPGAVLAGLADAAETVLKAKGVSVSRQSISVNTTDFSSLVTRVPSDADIVFFPTQQPADAQTFAQQLLEQGKKAKVFGGDGANSPDQFKVAGSYVSNFAPDISGIAVDKALDRRLEEGQPEGDARLVRSADLPRRRRSR